MDVNDKIINLEKRYHDLTKEGCLGGVHPLLEISDICYSLCSDSIHKKILPSYVLYITFKTLAEIQDEKMTLTSDCERYYDLLNNSIIKLINDLKNMPIDNILIQDIETLFHNLIELNKSF